MSVAGSPLTEGRLEQTHARIGQGVGVVGIFTSIVAALVVSAGSGLALLAVSGLTALFYTSVHLLLSRAVAVRAIRISGPLFEIVLPALAFWLLARLESPEFAAGSWLVPQLFAVFVAGSMLRLDPRIPAGMGVGAALLYGLVWWTEVASLGESGLAEMPLQIVRVSSLVAMGLAASYGASRLAAVLGEISATKRERDVIGRYTLGREIASGGMGRVLEAAYCPDGGFERRVAMKLLHPHLVDQPGYIDRFRTEAEITARLLHPNIVSALDFGRVGETWFLVMEYIDGRTLQDILSERRRLERPLPARVVAWIGVEVASGLDHAHRVAHDENGRPLGVVHRDLSPSNIMIDRSGRVRITDFGVSRMLGDGALETSTLVGKPAYVAPEILQNHRADTRSDLWSLGVILWEALTGERLFMRETVAATMLAVIEDPIPKATDLRKDIAPAWDDLFGRLLAREADTRMSSALDLGAALAAIATSEGPVLADDLRALLAPEESLEELDLDLESDAVAPDQAPQEPITSDP